jgi:hypothetical protein
MIIILKNYFKKTLKFIIFPLVADVPYIWPLCLYFTLGRRMQTAWGVYTVVTLAISTSNKFLINVNIVVAFKIVSPPSLYVIVCHNGQTDGQTQI